MPNLPKIDIPTLDLPDAAARPLYAGVGATDVAVEIVRGVVTDVQAKVAARVADVQQSVRSFELPEPKALQARATDTVAARRARVEARIAELQADAVALPGRLQSVPAGVRTRVDSNVTAVAGRYAELAQRGEAIVTRLREGAAPAVEQVVEQARKVEEAVEPTPAEKAAATRTEKAAKPATKPAAKKPAAKRSAAKKPAAKKSATKAPAKKATAGE
jgi:hypothetical protein